jgi:hypothetical protein
MVKLTSGKENNHIHPEDGQTTWKTSWKEGENHIHPEDGQTRRNGQDDLTEERRTTTYILRMGRQDGMVRIISQKKGEQPHTS